MVSWRRLVWVLLGAFCFVSPLVIDHLLNYGFEMQPTATAHFLVRLRRLAFSMPEYPHCIAVTLIVKNTSATPHSIYMPGGIPGVVLTDAAGKEHVIRRALDFPTTGGALDPLPPGRLLPITLLFDSLNPQTLGSLTLTSYSWQLPSEINITTPWPDLYALFTDSQLPLAGVLIGVVILLASSWPMAAVRKFCIGLLGAIGLCSLLFTICIAARDLLVFTITIIATLVLGGLMASLGDYKPPFPHPAGWFGELAKSSDMQPDRTARAARRRWFTRSFIGGGVVLSAYCEIRILFEDLPHLSSYILLLFGLMVTMYAATEPFLAVVSATIRGILILPMITAAVSMLVGAGRALDFGFPIFMTAPTRVSIYQLVLFGGLLLASLWLMPRSQPTIHGEPPTKGE